jgi:hypothetical protein
MVKKIVFSMAILTGLFGMPKAAFAVRCNGDLLDCFDRASKIDNVMYRTAAGLDCEFTYVDCTRRALFGR